MDMGLSSQTEKHCSLLAVKELTKANQAVLNVIMDLSLLRAEHFYQPNKWHGVKRLWQEFSPLINWKQEAQETGHFG